MFRPSFDSWEENVLPLPVHEQRLGIYVGWYAESVWTGDPDADGALVVGIETDEAAVSIRNAGFAHLQHQSGGVQCLKPEFLVKQIEPHWRFLEIARNVCRHYFLKPYGPQNPDFIVSQLGSVGINIPQGYYDALYESVYPIPLNDNNISIITGKELSIDEMLAPIGRVFANHEASIFIITDNSD